MAEDIKDKELHILIVEDVASDAQLAESELRREGIRFNSKRVETREAFCSEIAGFCPDVILSDCSLPSFDGLTALAIAREKIPDTPFIFVSGAIGEEAAIETLKKGATDYVLKDRLSRLGPVVKRALEEAKERVELKKTETDLLRREYQLEILSRTSVHVNRVLEVPVILRTLVAAAMELVDATGGCAGLLENGKMIFNEYNKGGKLEAVNYIFKQGQGIPGWSADTMKVCISNDVKYDCGVNTRKKVFPDLYNLISVPIIGGKGNIVGCFEIHNKKDKLAFDAQDAFMLQGLSSSAAIALDNAWMIEEAKRSKKEKERLNREIVKSNKKLQQLALKDTLTGLYNYRYLTEFIETEMYRGRRYNHPFSLVKIDLDYFRSVNEVYGHKTGDEVLKRFAALLKQLTRKYDIVLRSGGEEFVLVSSGANRATAIRLGDRILKAAESHNFGNKRHKIALKLSMAACSYPEDRVGRGSDMLDLADKILDRVKKDGGGNRIYSSLDLGGRKNAPLGAQNMAGLKKRLEKLSERGERSVVESVIAFAKTIELRDSYTGKHVENTVQYATRIANSLHLNKEDVESIRQASILHDLGKIGINDKILRKKSKLTEKEFAEIKKHPQIAVDIIRPIRFLHPIIPFLLHHHERWDGKGYPFGLKGDEIPMGARIISIADVYQALISDRPYRKAYPKEKAIEMIKKEAGAQFDPKVVTVFLKTLKGADRKTRGSLDE